MVDFKDRKVQVALAGAIGALLAFIAAFLDFMNIEGEGGNLKDIIEASDDLDGSAFNPQGLIIILTLVGMACMIVTIIKPAISKAALVTAGAGAVLILVMIIFMAGGAYHEVYDFADDWGLDVSAAAGVTLTYIGSILMCAAGALEYKLSNPKAPTATPTATPVA